jgi:hypothetical protein
MVPPARPPGPAPVATQAATGIAGCTGDSTHRRHVPCICCCHSRIPLIWRCRCSEPPWWLSLRSVQPNLLGYGGWWPAVGSPLARPLAAESWLSEVRAAAFDRCISIRAVYRGRAQTVCCAQRIKALTKPWSLLVRLRPSKRWSLKTSTRSTSPIVRRLLAVNSSLTRIWSSTSG